MPELARQTGRMVLELYSIMSLSIYCDFPLGALTWQGTPVDHLSAAVVEQPRPHWLVIPALKSVGMPALRRIDDKGPFRKGHIDVYAPSCRNLYQNLWQISKEPGVRVEGSKIMVPVYWYQRSRERIPQ